MVKKNDSTNLMELLCGVWEKGTRKEQWEQGKSLSKRHGSLYSMCVRYICPRPAMGLFMASSSRATPYPGRPAGNAPSHQTYQVLEWTTPSPHVIMGVARAGPPGIWHKEGGASRGIV